MPEGAVGVGEPGRDERGDREVRDEHRRVVDRRAVVMRVHHGLRAHRQAQVQGELTTGEDGDERGDRAGAHADEGGGREDGERRTQGYGGGDERAPGRAVRRRAQQRRHQAEQQGAGRRGSIRCHGAPR
ncbi:hypothetical protein GCM10023200_07220 [Actinomycetospora chlora]|uniref:Uncharacterized protein n=1 Tax=Actinomycetospora chlora TaxID=663608 RepID=A0ABP9AA61_9PSEU